MSFDHDKVSRRRCPSSAHSLAAAQPAVHSLPSYCHAPLQASRSLLPPSRVIRWLLPAAAATRCRCRLQLNLLCPFPSLQRVIIYPNYIDSRKTVAQGRRIPKELGAPAGACRECAAAAACRGERETSPRLIMQLNGAIAAPSRAAAESPNALEIYECIINGLKLEAEAEVQLPLEGEGTLDGTFCGPVAAPPTAAAPLVPCRNSQASKP